MKRDEIINQLSKDWDVIIIGGGITGAGVFNEASKQGLSTLLLEQHDFGWGTSSRSAKLVHGGLRYLGQGQINTTWHSVIERERLLKEYKDLIEPIRFLFPAYKNDITPHLLRIGLTIYDLMAGRRDYRYHDAINFQMQAPLLSIDGLKGGLSFTDAVTDDARLVLRVIANGENQGGVALNYTIVEDLLKDNKGQIIGVTVLDKISGKEFELNAQVVINATGIFTDNILSKLDKKPILRKLRGSHILFPAWRFPIFQAISFNHPRDKRPLYVIPWQGVTLYGTTDLEHDTLISGEPAICKNESEYLFDALDKFFPSLKLTKDDAISTFSGIRAVLDTGKENPSKESRDYIILSDNGLISVTGGKLTTFRLLALKTLKKAKKYIVSSMKKPLDTKTPTSPLQETANDTQIYRRLKKAFGEKAIDIFQDEKLPAMGYVDNTVNLWAELIWSARNEQVVHLEDLMLRRSRIGLITPNGGAHLLDKIEKYVAKDLGYDKTKFEEEKNRYLQLWQQAYSPRLL